MFCALFISACKTDNVTKITEGVKVISKCCEKLSEVKSKNALHVDQDKTAELSQKVSSILPAYFWDSKMMIW